jgi:hypothetical protein
MRTMKNAIRYCLPMLVLLLLNSCQALHRDIPKSKSHYKRRELVSLKEKEPVTIAAQEQEKPVPANVSEIPVTAIIAVKEESILQPEPIAAVKPIAAEAASSNRQTVVAPPQGDTLVVEEEIDEATVDEAMESERIALQAYKLSLLPAFTLLFFPLLFVGVIGTLSKLARFRRYEYVTEKGLDYERRAKLRLLLSTVIPIAFLVLYVLLLIAFL